MTALHDVGRALIVVGIALVVLGVALSFAGRLPWLGRLPGDIVIRRGGFTFYFPLGTCLLLSLMLTFLFWLWRR
jgi:hypothetical protein